MNALTFLTLQYLDDFDATNPILVFIKLPITFVILIRLFIRFFSKLRQSFIL